MREILVVCVGLCVMAAGMLVSSASSADPSVTYEARQPCFEIVTAKDTPNGPPYAMLFDACSGKFSWVRMPEPPEQGA